MTQMSSSLALARTSTMVVPSTVEPCRRSGSALVEEVEQSLHAEAEGLGNDHPTGTTADDKAEVVEAFLRAVEVGPTDRVIADMAEPAPPRQPTRCRRCRRSAGCRWQSPTGRGPRPGNRHRPAPCRKQSRRSNGPPMSPASVSKNRRSAPIGEADVALDAEHQRVHLPVVAGLKTAEEPVGAQAAAESRLFRLGGTTIDRQRYRYLRGI
jgi:hypothetical protein